MRKEQRELTKRRRDLVRAKIAAFDALSVEASASRRFQNALTAGRDPGPEIVDLTRAQTALKDATARLVEAVDAYTVRAWTFKTHQELGS